ncbi:polymorphic toxin-type HINT domain-containing protein [Amycolatopsis sp. NPDC051128]|uniref:polymorphic toxin-type HINT domain-containing protein n=1 Tax=Amycolatopsis sp. NPDC051128 TaxID=3155412 RepID=UPI00341D555A
MSGALSAAGSGALAGGVWGAAFGALGGLRPRGRSSAAEEEAPSSKCETAEAHSFFAGTKVLLADGTSKLISSVKAGDRVANSQPGKAGVEAHPVDRVIVPQTDHDFVDLKVKPSRARRAVGRAAAVLAVAAAAVTGGAVTASAAPATLTTTYHHPFYDVTRGAFVEAVNLRVGDHLQTADGGEATVEEVTPYHSTEVTYDLTIDQLHTYYVLAGDVPVLVHNCGEALEDFAASQREVPGTKFASEYTSPSGEKYYSTNRHGTAGELQDMPELQDAVSAAGHHGGCAEVGYLIQAYAAEGPSAISGGMMRTVNVRNPMSSRAAEQGTPAFPCGRCQRLLEGLGIGVG